jgi:hypothetical protein
VNAPSADEPNLQVATVVEVGQVMKEWKSESGSGTWTRSEDQSAPDLPPLRLTDPTHRGSGSERAS